MNGDLHGLPSMTVYAGSRDVLYPDTLRLRDRAAAEDVDATFELRPGLMHGWAGLVFLPEARAVRRDLVDRLVGADAPDGP